MQKLQLLLLRNRLDKNKKIFFAELIGTFIVILFVTGSVMLNGKLNGALGFAFIAIASAIAVAIGVYLFGKISMAHFNPVVTVAFLITKHLERKKELLIIYLLAEIISDILASFFIYFILGNEVNLDADAPNYTNFSISVIIIGIKILASALLMLIILIVIYTKGLKIWRFNNWCYSRFRYLFVWFDFWCFNEFC